MRALITAVLALSIGVCAVPTSHIGRGSAPTATVKNGTLVGRHVPEYNQDFFLGVPFAQPPVGDLRFRQAVPLNSSWSKPRDASQYQSECVGYGSDQWGYPISEDCLYLNIIRPAGCDGADLPVALWIHGGGFTEGGAVDKRYNLSFIVQNSVKIGKPIIGVSVAYRLSAWGFLYSDEMFGQGLANIGLRDQRLAMHWVQENIAAFGGDPKKVTIWGESAGAASVGFHLTAYGGRNDNLFRAAMMESGNPIAYGAEGGTATAQPVFNNITSKAGCSQSLDKVQCLRDAPFATLNNAINTTLVGLGSIGPALDGDFIRNYGSIQLANGEFVKVPIIVGANSDEGTAFSPSPINNTAMFQATLANLPSTLQTQLLEAYPDDLSVNVVASMGDSRPPAFLGDQFRRSASYWGDYVFIAPRRQTCTTWAANGLDAYCYRFNAIPAGIPYYIGVTHFQEVSFVFDNILGVGYPPVATAPFLGKPQSYIDLAFLMSASWASFVNDLDPNNWKGRNSKVAPWPKYDVSNPMNIVWDANVTSHTEPDTFRKEGMDLINANAAGVYHR